MAVRREIRSPFNSPAPSEVGQQSTEGEQTSIQLSQKLAASGFTRKRVGSQQEFTRALQQLWSDSPFVFTGNFAEGWGCSASRVDGRCSHDSLLVCNSVQPDYSVHLRDWCQCQYVPNEQRVIVRRDGSVELNMDCVPKLQEMGLVQEKVQEVGQLPAQLKEMRQLEGSSSGPSLRLQPVFTCCSCPTLPRFESLPQLQPLELQQQPVFVKPNEFAPAASRKAPRAPTGQLDFSPLLRTLFRNLNENQGRVYFLLKYLLLEAAPEAGCSEAQCKQLMLQLLQRPQHEFADAGCLLKMVDAGLQLLLRQESEAPLFPFAAALPQLSTEQRRRLQQLRSNARGLLQRLQLRSLLPGLQLSFHPQLLLIPGVGAEAMGIGRCASAALQIFQLLLSPQPVGDNSQAVLQLLGRVGSFSRLAALCLSCLLRLKANNGAADVRDLLQQAAAAAEHLHRGFQDGASADSLMRTVIGHDCSWQFAARLWVKETQEQRQRQQQRHELRVQGSEFICGMPMVRYVFFAARPSLRTQGDAFVAEYSLNVNFVALLHCLQLQAGHLRLQETTLWSWWQRNKFLEAQELFVLSLELKERRQLLKVFNELRDRLFDFRGREQSEEWQRQRQLLLRLQFAWLQELPTDGRWQQQEAESCRQLLDLMASCGCKEAKELRPLVEGRPQAEDAKTALKKLWKLQDAQVAEQQKRSRSWLSAKLADCCSSASLRKSLKKDMQQLEG